MWFSRLNRWWRYRALQKAYRESTVLETVDLAVSFINHTRDSHTLLFNSHIADWVEWHFRLLYRYYRKRRRVTENLWVLYHEWRTATTVARRASALGNLVIYVNGLRYPLRDDILVGVIDYLRIGIK